MNHQSEKEKEEFAGCPCKRIKCERHGDCAACREHHLCFKRKMRPACDRLKDKAVKKDEIKNGGTP